jgi:hypothetical protein
MSVVLAGESSGIVLLTEPFSGGGGVSSVTGSGNIASSGGATPNITFTGTLPVGNGGTGVTASSGASSVVLRDANGNITTNATFNGFTSVAASGTPIVLTAASTPVYQVTGSGGQVIQLPNATTLSNGAIFSFNNNQSSGAITVNNASATLIASVPSGGYVTIVLLSNATSAGSWDRHDQTPSNVSWSTNTFDYPGSITSATWNGATIAVNRGGTGQTTTTAAINALLPTQSTNSGKYLTTDGTNTSWATVSGGGSPGGSTTQIQYNNAGAFAGLANLITDGTNVQVNNQAAMRFSNATTNYVAFKAPAALSSNTTWTLPGTDGTTGQTIVTNGSGTLTWATPTLTPVAPANYALPVVSGTATVGQTLSCTTGGWSGYPAPTYAYQWVRGAATNISGATSSTYTLVDADYNNTVKCTVTATNSAGSASATSAATATVAGTVPGAPTIGTATAGNAQASVAFTAPAVTGGPSITSYTATSSPGGITGSSASSPITVSGLTNGTAYTFTVTATNSIGTGAASAASNSVTPTLVVQDPSFSYVPLLLETTSTNGQNNQGTTTTNGFLDSSTNNFTITRSGSPTQGSLNPYWPNGQWSNYFNGTNAYLTYNQTFALGTNDFTLEFWLYVPIQVPYPTNYWLWGWRNGTDNCPALNLSSNLSGTNILYFLGGASVFLTNPNPIPTNTWTHVAIVRSGLGANNLKMYVNGVQVAQSSTTQSFTYTGTQPVGANPSGDGSLYPSNVYFSNFRIVNGTAVYTAAFTPPTTPLTAISNTGILTCQSNRFIDTNTQTTPKTITVNGTPRVQAFQPFSPAAAYTPAAYGGSVYLNGSDAYLTYNQTFALGTNDFTLEFWLNIPVDVAYPTNYWLWGWRNGSASCPALSLGGLSGGGNALLFGGYGVSLSNPNSIPTNTWTHVAIVRSGLGTNNLKMYINGVQVAQSSTTQSFTYTGTQPVGANPSGDGSLYPSNVYFSNFRIVNGTAVYTAAFTPPTSPLTAITNTALLLNFTNAGIYDATTQNVITTVGDAQASTTQKQWGTTSMKYDGTGDWLTVLDSPQLQIGTGDFTIDGWVYLSTNGIVYGLVSKGTATTGWSVNVTTLNKLQFSYTTSNLTGTTSLATGTWYYFAVVRSGSATGNLKLYLNASLEATSGGAVTDNFNQTSTLYVGADRIGSSALNGYLQDVRVTKAARTITLPTQSFPVQ